MVGPAQARRVALVIGNSAYQVGPLANPVNDAEAIAGAFADLGFDKVILKKNLGIDGMRTALTELSREAVGADIAVAYFAGHGTERDGRNYLIPVDARLERASDLELQAIALSTVIDQLTGAAKLRLVILDACRNNVFPLTGTQRSIPRGLARVEPGDSTLVAYAATEGTTADDGPGRHCDWKNRALALRQIETAAETLRSRCRGRHAAHRSLLARAQKVDFPTSSSQWSNDPTEKEWIVKAAADLVGGGARGSEQKPHYVTNRWMNASNIIMPTTITESRIRQPPST
jgi:hypothetical protein